MINKEIILSHCIVLLQQRISNAQLAVQEAHEATTNEEKSSAGDKYETARAMGHLASEMNAKQLHKAIQELQLLKQIDIGHHTMVKPGSLVETENNLYFIGVGLGPLQVHDITVVMLSAQAPLAKLLIGKKTGSTVTLNNQSQTIKNIF